MTEIDSKDYKLALKAGKKDYQHKRMHGETPTLKVLDQILPQGEILSEIPLGIIDIPTELIDGTKSEGRRNAFSSSFMPLLNEDTEFALKWMQLCASHISEGIREPVKAYEYMNRFYIQEGNKRVSVLKYFGAASIPGDVTRLLPRKSDKKEIRVYYEFLEFYKKSNINRIYFTNTGSFDKLLRLMSKDPGEDLTKDERLDLLSLYTSFSKAYDEILPLRKRADTSDSFLSIMSVYGYDTMIKWDNKSMKEMIKKSILEYYAQNEDSPIDIVLSPESSLSRGTSFLSKLLPKGQSSLKIGFIHEKSPELSPWTYSHDLGRMYLEEQFPNEVQTIVKNQASHTNIDSIITECIGEDCDLIFTTAPTFTNASVKAAIEFPHVRILNCSLNTSHMYIRTYHARMHEAKFLMGIIAGAMAKNNRISYIANYPIYGVVANINAFALGAKLVNPWAMVKLEWTSLKDSQIYNEIEEFDPDVISGMDSVIPNTGRRDFGLYAVIGDSIKSLALPLYNWGKFYESMIRNILSGQWNRDEHRPVNYWWGLSSGMVDVVYSKNIPIGTRRLVEQIRKDIIDERFNPFSGIMYSQENMITGHENAALSIEEISSMNWLCENIIGHIPAEEELVEEARFLAEIQGVRK